MYACLWLFPQEMPIVLEGLQVEEATNVSEPDVVATGAQAPARLSLQRVCARVCICVCLHVYVNTLYFDTSLPLSVLFRSSLKAYRISKYNAGCELILILYNLCVTDLNNL